MSSPAPATTAPPCVYAFDLLQFGGQVRGAPLESRRETLCELIARTTSDLIRFSESFAYAETLMEECARLGFEGIVAKHKDSPYRSGTCSGWIKVKCDGWNAANEYRKKLFNANK